MRNYNTFSMYLKKISLSLLLLGSVVANAQEGFRAGFASESIEPGNESFSVALSGYAGPWAGRFAVRWESHGTTKENGKIIKNVNTPGGKTVKASGVAYQLSAEGTLRIKQAEKWSNAPALPGPALTSFVIQHPYVYGSNGTDTLYKYHIDNPEAGWNRALYYNGQIRKVAISKLFTHQNKLYAISSTDSLFSASLIHGSPEEHSYARALAIESGGNKALIICMDLCGFNSDMIDEVKGAIGRKTGLKPESILINASHTHFIPGTQRWLPWAPHNRYPDVNYMEKVVKPAMIKAGIEAASKTFPANLSVGRGTTTIGRNRSNGSSSEPYDNAVDVLKVQSTDGKKQAILALTGCHPVYGTKGVRHFTISSNYPGFMRSAVEKAATTPTMALFMQGCAGDINPKDEPQISGAKLAEDVQRILSGAMTPLSGAINSHLDSLLIPTKPMEKEQIIAYRAENAKSAGQMEPDRNIAWADLMLKHYQNNTMPKHMPIYIQTLNIGQWKLVGLSREVVTEYSLAIKKIWPEKMVSVAGYCNDVSSYLPAERHIRTRTYEGEGSSIWYGMPSPFPLDVLDQVVNRIKTNNR